MIDRGRSFKTRGSKRAVALLDLDADDKVRSYALLAVSVLAQGGCPGRACRPLGAGKAPGQHLELKSIAIRCMTWPPNGLSLEHRAACIAEAL